VRKKIGNAVAFASIMQAWEHDDREVIGAFGSDVKFVNALRHVAPPHGRTTQVRAWRGIILKEAHPHEAAVAVAWTTERDIAAWFATRRYEPGLRPFVFCTEFEPSAVVVFHDRRREAEIIVDLFGFCERRLIVDHDGTDWSTLDHMAMPSAAAIASWCDARDRWERAKNVNLPPS
jgi:hypothetical protein